MKRRPRRSGLATATAVVVLAACVLVTVVAIQMIIGERPWIRYDSVATALHDARWDAVGTAVVGGAVALVGLVLLVAAVVPGRPAVLPLAGDEPDLDSGANRRSTRAALRATASGVDGVRSAKLRLTGGRVVAAVRTDRVDPAGIDEAVRAALSRRLDQITPERRPSVRVRVRSTRSAS